MNTKVHSLELTSADSAGKIKELTDKLEQGIEELFESERFKNYLKVMSQFHNYSVNNTILIAMQKPDAALVAGYYAWRNKFHRQVLKGEKGIKVFAPAPYKIKKKMEMKDTDTGKVIIGRDGKPVMEETEITVPAFKVVSVFDVSQTEGKELPSIGVDELTGDVEQYSVLFKAAEQAAPVPVNFEKIKGRVKGYYHQGEKRIVINEGMSELQNLKTLIHETAHARLHDIDLSVSDAEQADPPDRRTREVQAESVAYAVCQHYGLDTSDYSFAYVAGWSSGKELSELKASLETIRSTVSELIKDIDKNFVKLREEKKEVIFRAEPMVTIIWSENAQLQEGTVMPLLQANELMNTLDEESLGSPGYDKTKFHIDFVMNGMSDTYEGEQRLGEGDGTLIDHIEKYNEYYENNGKWEQWLLQTKGRKALETDRERRDILLHEFIPYLKMHCNLSKMERAAQSVMQSGDGMTQAEISYYAALQQYVSECRGMLNQGNYDMPPAPEFLDFDSELQEYEKHVEKEIRQEAASDGMKTEESAKEETLQLCRPISGRGR